MRRTFVLTFSVFMLVAGAAKAFRAPETNVAWPTQHQREARYVDNISSPYAMNYADEAAQRLGVHEGRWEAFDTRSSDPLMPSFHGGIDQGRAAISLQWHPGE